MNNGDWITKSSYRRTWARIMNKLQEVSEKEIKNLTAHVFRHNYCSKLCYQIPTISIKKIAELLGDTEKMVIDVYNHIIEDNENVTKAVENSFISATKMTH